MRTSDVVNNKNLYVVIFYFYFWRFWNDMFYRDLYVRYASDHDQCRKVMSNWGYAQLVAIMY